MEHRRLDCEVRIGQRDDKPVITGYAARYYDAADPGTEYRFKLGKDTVIERIMPGAFSRALSENDVAALFNHDPNHVLGRTSAGTLRLQADGNGLGYEIDPPDSASGIVASIARKDIRGSSFSFLPHPGGQTWRDAEVNGQRATIREINSVQLFDVGPVTFPAYGAASSGIRAYDPEALLREIEEMRSGRLADLLNNEAARRRRAMRAREIEIS